MTDIKNDSIEIANLRTSGCIRLSWSDGGISIKMRLFHNQFKTPCRMFKCK